MHITAVCPRCESRYQVDEGLCGKRMRCPNPLCRTVFEVATGERPAPTPLAELPVAPPTKPEASVTGSVTDLIPLLPAELAEPSPPEARAPRPQPPAVRPPGKAPKPEADPPPIRARVPAPLVEPKPSSVPEAPPAGHDAAAPDDFPGDFPGDDEPSTAPPAELPAEPPAEADPTEAGPGTWEAPPIRAAAADAPPSPVSEPVGDGTAEPRPARTGKRRAVLIIGVLAIVLAGTLGAGWWFVESARAGNEADRFRRAQEQYDQGEFDEARDALQRLAHDFPSSDDARKYRFLAELSGVRGEVAAAHDTAELASALEHVQQFVGFNHNDRQLKEHQAEVWQSLHRLAVELTKHAEKEHARTLLELGQRAWTEAEKLQPPSSVNEPQVKSEVTAAFARVDRSLNEHDRRQAVIAALRRHVDRATAAGVQESRALAAAAGLKDDAEVQQLLADLVVAHRAAVRYVPAGEAGKAAAPEDDVPSIVVVPTLARARTDAARGSVKLALARGVLYAFDSLRGELRWARRVGFDTTVLPLRIPADLITPELVLVLSSDSKTVAAHVADSGAVVWRHGLSQACTGTPVRVGRSLFIPTLDGRVDEVEISGGRLLGHFDLGQPLTVGGARQPGTSLVYFPGDAFCVYVLDVAARTCTAVLYANQPAGSLRGVPIFLSGEQPSGDAGKGPTGWMVLCQAQGTQGVELRAFDLPIRNADQAPATAPLHMPGLAWFPPWHDAEKLALATDASLLSLWGIRQRGNRGDPLLFPLLANAEPYAIAGGGPGRAQVVHADANGYWVLSGGRLHHLESVMRPKSGPGLAPAGPPSPELGTPLHESQADMDAAGHASLFLSTLALDRPACLATAIDLPTGQFRWQRQLGCVALHAPAVLDRTVLLRDASGLLLLDSKRFSHAAKVPGQALDQFLVRQPLGADDRVALLTSSYAFVQLSWSNAAPATECRLRQIAADGASSEWAFPLRAVPAGTPALGDGFILVPLANGIAVRIDYHSAGPSAAAGFGPGMTVGTRTARGSEAVTAGPNWRAAGVDERSAGHVVRLDGDTFLMTDGSRGLALVYWADPKIPQHRGSAKLSHRIIAPPAVLPAQEGNRPRICVADASDTLTLLDGDRLQTVRRWALPGRITAGPFVRGKGVLCILDQKRMVWIDPDQGEPLWEYTLVSAIVGAPPLVDGMLVAADVSGTFLALDPKTGGPRGPGYTLRANAAPDAAPVPFGPGRLLVPLNDGTLLLLPLAKLQ